MRNTSLSFLFENEHKLKSNLKILEENDLYSVREVAEHFGRSRDYIRDMCAGNILSTLKISGRIYIILDEKFKFIWLLQKKRKNKIKRNRFL